MGKRELVALLYLSSWCLVMVERLFLTVQLCCLRFVIVVFPDHNHLLFLKCKGFLMGHLNIQGHSNKIEQERLLLKSENNHIHVFGFE